MISESLRRRLDRWPEEMSRALHDYLKPWRAAGRQEGHPIPYWYLFPQLMWKRYRALHAGVRAGRGFLRDLLLGQYCLFLSFRIQDDLLDNQAQSPLLAFVANRLFVEAREVFARHFPDHSRFWFWHERLLRETVWGIFAVRQLHRTPARSPRLLFSQYVRVASVFKIALAGVCVKARRENELRPVGTCADRLAVFGQILDDLEDLSEDLSAGRYNSCTSILAPGIRNHRRYLQNIGRELVIGNGTDRIAATLADQLVKAERAIAPLRSPALVRYLRLHERYRAGLEQHLYQLRVGALLGSPAGGNPRRHNPVVE